MSECVHFSVGVKGKRERKRDKGEERGGRGERGSSLRYHFSQLNESRKERRRGGKRRKKEE